MDKAVNLISYGMQDFNALKQKKVVLGTNIKALVIFLWLSAHVLKQLSII